MYEHQGKYEKAHLKHIIYWNPVHIFALFYDF